MPYDSVVRALYAYEATAGDELTFAEDEILYILPDEEGRDDSWLLARPLRSENPELSGLVPANYVAPVRKLCLVHFPFMLIVRGRLHMRGDL